MMIAKKSYRKFHPQQKEIEALEKKNDRFKRIFTEYEHMAEELWDLENSDVSNIPDDFINAMKVQTEYLEDEIGDWLATENKSLDLR
ncbi:hypothetical protein FIC_02120 [Flavobacteriaceae bacterium 3519-10]|nr:hypothetical protein FIC_02120 [Flavobacteriaceae bacterium 3519-10]